MFNPIYENFGVIKVDGNRINIYKDVCNYQNINVGAPVSHAIWNSGFLIVYLRSGEARRYRDHYYFDRIM
jgi:hypothetical protein